jgi:RNA polymerase sigma factor (sigma-70 family)
VSHNSGSHNSGSHNSGSHNPGSHKPGSHKPGSHIEGAPADHPDPHDRAAEDVTLADLVDAVRAGCPGAWRVVVARFDGHLHAVARGYGLDGATADDAVQQTWLAAITHLTALREPAALAGWLRRIVHRECLRAVNRASREVPVVEQDLGDPVSPAYVALRPGSPEQPEDGAIHREEIAALREAVRRRLSAREQDLMAMLTDSSEHSYTEISRALGLPVGSIGPTRARCIAKLRPLLAG